MMIQEFNYSVNLLQNILWQYDEATNLVSLINQKQDWYNDNQTAFWQNWFTNVFNLQTANAFGVTVWSYILNVPLFVGHEPEPANKPLFGFNGYQTPFNLTGTVTSGSNVITGLSSNTGITLGSKVSDGGVNIPVPAIITALNGTTEAIMSGNATGDATETISFSNLENSYLNFGNSNFSTKGEYISLSLEEQRFLLRLRYFQLSNRGDITDINAFLNYLINSSNIGYTGQLYALDGLNMTMTYVFTGTNFPSNLIQIMKELDLFPRPTAVGLKIRINYGNQFGFNNFVGSYPNYENTNQNFGNGNFLAP